MHAAQHREAGHRESRLGGYVPLFWRLFVPNAAVLVAASVVLMLRPPNGRILVLGAGLVLMLAVNVVLMRRAFVPLSRLTRLTERVDPLRPGERLPLPRSHSEVTVITESFNAMLDRLESERRDSARRALSEREAERRRLAAELHDELGQDLTAILLQLERTAESAPPGVRDALLEIREDVRAGIEDVRRLARQLRPETLDTLGLVPALTNLAERLAERTGMPIDRSFTRDLPPLGDEAELVIFRVMQESLTNALRHAGASRIEVRLERLPGQVVLTVRDDGTRAGPLEGEDGGIRTMRERAISVDGQLEIGGRDGTGTEVLLRVPAAGS